MYELLEGSSHFLKYIVNCFVTLTWRIIAGNFQNDHKFSAEKIA